MNLYIEIRDLFGAKENEHMQHSTRMEKLTELINKSQKEYFQYGLEEGVWQCKIELEQKLQKIKGETQK